MVVRSDHNSLLPVGGAVILFDCFKSQEIELPRQICRGELGKMQPFSLERLIRI